MAKTKVAKVPVDAYCAPTEKTNNRALHVKTGSPHVNSNVSYAFMRTIPE